MFPASFYAENLALGISDESAPYLTEGSNDLSWSNVSLDDLTSFKGDVIDGINSDFCSCVFIDVIKVVFRSDK